MKNKEIEELLNELKEVTNSKKLSSTYCITNKHWQLLLSYIEQLENKYDKALETLVDFNMPCERDEFNLIDTDYCEKNCSVDDEQYKKCWDRWIEWRLENESNKRNSN